MTTHEPIPQEKGSRLDTESCWALLERVVSSPQLRRASRMREFLLYVGRRSLKEGCDQIPEQEIGSKVFGRHPGYDTSADNIVRVNATDLRKRIESYFEAEGAHESLILDIPRGGYKPVFRVRPVKADAFHQPTDPATSQAAATVANALGWGRASSDRRLLALAGVAIVILSIACGVLLTEIRTMRRSLYAWQSTPSVGSFWSGILNATPKTDVILADTSFSLIEDILRKPISLNNYLSRDYVNQILSKDLSQDRRDDLDLIIKRNYGSLGDFRATQRIVALDPLGKKVRLYYARDYTPALIKEDNIILIGSRKSNPWVDLFSGSMNFTVEYDPDRFVSFIKNRAPIASEQAIYTAPPAPDPDTGYSVVAYLPNNEHTGKVLILAGTGSEATEGAGEFVTSEDQLARFHKMLHMSTLPYFEVLLKTTHLNGTPMDAKIVAYRTYQNR